MTEKLLQFIWQHRHFNLNDLQTTSGEKIIIIHSGNINHHQGPDFINGRLQIGNETWIGNIELHVQASEWNDHQHTDDPLYKNIILHVVWKEDKKLNLPFPVLELQNRISKTLLCSYERLMQSPQFIACQDQIHLVPEVKINAWKQRMLIERLEQKTKLIFELLNENNFHWEETFFWLIASGFGIKVNSDSFLKIARSIPFNILMKHKHQLHQLEALLLGQAGILDTTFSEKYPLMLQKEFYFLQKKYHLQKVHYPLYYLRMRPSNFPTIRLAQLAMLMNKNEHLFSTCIETGSVKDVLKTFEVCANDYWHYHYLPDQPSAFQMKKTGKDAAQAIIINAVIPFMYAYGTHHENESYCSKALLWMEQLQGENNSVTRKFSALHISVKTAFDTQALIQMKNEYCNNKMCLQCAVGYCLLNE